MTEQTVRKKSRTLIQIIIFTCIIGLLTGLYFYIEEQKKQESGIYSAILYSIIFKIESRIAGIESYTYSEIRNAQRLQDILKQLHNILLYGRTYNDLETFSVQDLELALDGGIRLLLVTQEEKNKLFKLLRKEHPELFK